MFSMSTGGGPHRISVSCVGVCGSAVIIDPVKRRRAPAYTRCECQAWFKQCAGVCFIQVQNQWIIKRISKAKVLHTSPLLLDSSTQTGPSSLVVLCSKEEKMREWDPNHTSLWRCVKNHWFSSIVSQNKREPLMAFSSSRTSRSAEEVVYASCAGLEMSFWVHQDTVKSFTLLGSRLNCLCMHGRTHRCVFYVDVCSLYTFNPQMKTRSWDPTVLSSD